MGEEGEEGHLFYNYYSSIFTSFFCGIMQLCNESDSQNITNIHYFFLSYVHPNYLVLLNIYFRIKREK